MPLIAARRYQGLLKNVGLLLVIAILAIALTVKGHQVDSFTGIARNSFLNPTNLVEQIGRQMSWYAVMAVGMTIVIITGGIDISVGSIMGLAAMMTAWAVQSIPPEAGAWRVMPWAIGLPIAIGMGCGLINGLLVVSLRLHPFIVTLGTMSIFRGLVNVLPPGHAKNMPVQPFRVPDVFSTHFMQVKWHAAEVMPLIVMLVVVALGWVYLRLTVPGIQTFAVGGNEEAARLSGVRVNVIKVIAYVISGACAGIGGMLLLGVYGRVSASSATGYELTVVAAAVVGGASLAGGRGAAFGALLGALIIRLIENAIDIMQWSQDYQQIIVGIAIVIAAAIDRFTDKLTGRTR